MKKMNLFSEHGFLKGRRVFIISCALAMVITTTTVSMAASDTIKSQGRIIFDNDTEDTSDDVIFDASDLTLIETQIDAATTAATEGKNGLIDSLKDKLPSSVTDQLTEDSTYEDIANAIASIGAGSNVTANQLLAGIKAYDGTEVITGTMPNNGTVLPNALAAGESYTIPEGYHSGSGSVTTKSLASQTGVTGTYTNNHGTDDTSDDTTDNLAAATADNLSLGTAAWVDGQYIVGTGGDNNSYYNLGYADGLAEISNAAIQYTYHTHDDVECGKTAIYHTHTRDKCAPTTICDQGPEGDADAGETVRYWGYCDYCGERDSCNWTKGTTKCSNCYSACSKSTSTIEGYKYTCEYEEGDIESATIKF